MSQELQQEITALVAEITEIEAERIEPQSHLVMDLGADSMAALELMAALEKRYQIVIDPEYLPEMSTLERIVELVGRLLKKEEGGR